MSFTLRISLVLTLAIACAPCGASEPAPSSSEVFGAWSYYNNMGWGAYYDHDLDLARDRFTHAVEYLRPYQKEYPRLMSRSCHDLSRVLCEQGRYSDAEPLAKWVVEAREHDPRTRDDVMFDSVYLLAVVYRRLDRDPALVVPPLRKAVAIEEKHLGPRDVRLAWTLRELADAEAQSGAIAAADEHYRLAIEIHQNDAKNLDLADALAGRADVLAKLGRSDDAAAASREAEAILAGTEGTPRPFDHLSTTLAARLTRPQRGR